MKRWRIEAKREETWSKLIINHYKFQSLIIVNFNLFTVTAAYTGELGTGHFLRYKRKSALTGDFYFKIRFWGFKNLRFKRKSGLSDYGLSGGHCTI